jgi:hypothetical protein
MLPKGLKQVGSCVEEATAQRTAKMQARTRRVALASRRCADEISCARRGWCSR